MKRIKDVSDSMIISNLIGMAQDAACDPDRQMYLENAIRLMKQKREGRQALPYHNLIFDLDGTLIDTENAVLKTWQLTLKKYHYRYSLDELRCVLGITTKSALNLLHVTVDAYFEQNWMKNYERFAAEADFFPGTKEMLSALKSCGCSTGVVTSRCRKEYNDYFGIFHLEKLFDRIVCADDTARHKPDPAPLYKYAKLEKADLSACIYIGDMPTDMECAKKAGIAAGLVLWNHSGILCREADFLFRTPDELLELLL